MSLLTTYGANNRVIISGKTRRITSVPIGDPTVTVEKQSDGTYKAKTEQWYCVTAVWFARYQYVGMNLQAATKCADDMRSKFTRTKKLWEYKLSTDEAKKTFEFKWESKDVGTVLDSEISMENQGGGMFSVTINASCTDEYYSTTPSSVNPSAPSCMNDVP